MVKIAALKRLELRPWKFQNLSLGGSRADLSSGNLEHHHPPTPPPPQALKPLSHLQAIYPEVPGSPILAPIQVSLGQKMGQNGPEEGPLVGHPGQCPAPLWASVS